MNNLFISSVVPFVVFYDNSSKGYQLNVILVSCEFGLLPVFSYHLSVVQTRSFISVSLLFDHYSSNEPA